MNVAVKLGRARVMRTIAAWLEKRPDLPIRRLSVNADGSVHITPADSENARPWREREIHDLYALADTVGAEVEFAPDEYRDVWKLTARWMVGAVPASAEVDVRNVAVSVRPIESTRAAS